MSKSLCALTVVLTLTLVAPTVAQVGSQQANPYLEVDKRILAEVYTSSAPMDNLKELCDVHGSRFPGLPGDKGAVDYIVETFKEYDLANVHAEEFTINGWTRGPATLEIVSPIQRSFDVISLPHSIGAEVEGKLVFLGDGAIEDYENRKDEIEGNIVMVTSANPASMSRRLHRSEKYMRSVMAGATGWIFMNHYPAYGPPTGGINPVIPAIGIAYEDGAFLSRLARARKGGRGQNQDHRQEPRRCHLERGRRCGPGQSRGRRVRHRRKSPGRPRHQPGRRGSCVRSGYGHGDRAKPRLW